MLVKLKLVNLEHQPTCLQKSITVYMLFLVNEKLCMKNTQFEYRYLLIRSETLEQDTKQGQIGCQS